MEVLINFLVTFLLRLVDSDYSAKIEQGLLETFLDLQTKIRKLEIIENNIYLSTS